MTHYDTLGVNPSVASEDIRAAWRRRIKECRARHLESDEKRINSAYNDLKTEALRVAYDRKVGLASSWQLKTERRGRPSDEQRASAEQHSDSSGASEPQTEARQPPKVILVRRALYTSDRGFAASDWRTRRTKAVADGLVRCGQELTIWTHGGGQTTSVGLDDRLGLFEVDMSIRFVFGVEGQAVGGIRLWKTPYPNDAHYRLSFSPRGRLSLFRMTETYYSALSTLLLPPSRWQPGEIQRLSVRCLPTAIEVDVNGARAMTSTIAESLKGRTELFTSVQPSGSGAGMQVSSFRLCSLKPRPEPKNEGFDRKYEDRAM
jgi:hypothetical protein